jgi:glutamate--cysteine ligase
LRALPAGALGELRRGIEKESLRVRPDGSLALTPHAPSLGSALTHPHITTDFSESQLELITGVHPDADHCLQELTEIHQVVMRAIGDELLWASSMPCNLPADEAIPIGRYGTSNVGRAPASRTATAGACRRSRASTTTSRCRASAATATSR